MTSTREVVERLRLALDQLASALASGDPAAVLACELPMADALRATRSAMRRLTPTEAGDIRRLIAEAREALDRCRRLGETIVVLATATANAPHGYGRRGVPLDVTARATVSSRT
jgi:hypothetical protein